MTASRLSKAVAALSAAAVLFSTLFAVPAAAAQDPAIDSRPVAPPSTASQAVPAEASGRFIVKFKPGAPGDASARAKAYGQAARSAGVSVKELRAAARGATVVQATETLTPGESAGVLASLRGEANVEYAEQDTFLRPAATPNDPQYPKQWDLHEDRAGMRVPAAWDLTSGLGAIVAVIDTGITQHNDLAGVLPGYDFISESTMSNDGDGRDADATDAGDYCNGEYSSWHGTHVAGTIGAAANNGEGVAGIAPSSKILPIRALGACGGYMSDIADAVVWAAGGAVSGVPASNYRPQVINMSLGGAGQCGYYLQSALDFAAAQGVTVVAAAGNEDSPASGATPANCNRVVTVGATGREGNRAPYSNYGPEVDVSAPGGDASTGGANTILSTLNTGTTVPGSATYGYMQGTSMAAPHIAGLAALIVAASPNLTPAQIEDILKQTARPLPGTCDTGGCGTGLTDAGAALRAARPDLQTPSEPAVAGTPTISGEAKVGSTLTANPGTWTPGPVMFDTEWLRNDVPIEGATQDSYVPVGADAGATLKVRVRAYGGYFDGVEATSAATQPVAVGTQTVPAPTIKGTVAVGQTLTAVTDAWEQDAQLAFQWYRGGTAIPGATAAAYTVTAAELGQALTVTVTGAREGYNTLTASSAPTAAVALGTLAGQPPGYGNPAKVNSWMVAYDNHSSWTRGTQFTDGWYRDGQPIPWETDTVYTPKPADLGHTLTFRVTGRQDGYVTKTLESKPIIVGPGTLSDLRLGLAGTAKVGQTLKTTFASSSYMMQLRWQWFRSGVAIPAATGSIHVLTASDLGKSITAKVTATRTAYTTLVMESPALLIGPGTLTAPTPLISGTRKVGYTLTAAPGTWTLGTTLKYQWYRSGVPITGATASKYTLTAADRGKIMRLRVSGIRAGYTTLIKDSPTTAVIATGTLVAGTPWISGTPRYGYTLTANPRTWTSGTTLRYQWYRSGAPIAGATGRTYRLVWADRYDTLKVRVVGSKAGYTTVTKYSGSTVRIP